LSINSLGVFFAFSLILFFPNHLFAATLSIADNLVLRELDDKRLQNDFFINAFSRENSIKLSKGSHTLLIKYKDVYEDLDFAEDRLVESELFIVKFTLTNQQTLKLMTPKIENLLAAENFSQSPEIILTDENDTVLFLQLEKHKDYLLSKQVEKVVTALPKNVVLIKETKHGNLAEQADTINQVKAISKSESQTFNEQVLTQTKSLPMLKYWWQRASDREKQKFILYTQGQ